MFRFSFKHPSYSDLNAILISHFFLHKHIVASGIFFNFHCHIRGLLLHKCLALCFLMLFVAFGLQLKIVFQPWICLVMRHILLLHRFLSLCICEINLLSVCRQFTSNIYSGLFSHLPQINQVFQTSSKILIYRILSNYFIFQIIYRT